MWRDIDPRAHERERPEVGRGRAGGGAEMGPVAASEDPRGVFTRDLDLPRGPSRERVRVNDREYRLSGDDVRVLATVGAFRVVPASDLREPNPRTPTRPARDLERLRELGLVRTTPYVVGRRRTNLVTLTSEGRAILEQGRRPGAAGHRQTFYVGITKPRELAHDSRVYGAYMKAADRLADRGDRVHRVVLEEQLKREYQRFLQAENRARREGGEPPEDREQAIARWAHEHELPYEDGHVQLPDARIEYEDRDGRRAVEDIEVITPHYRGAHAAAKARSGFSRYRAFGARLGGLRTIGRSGRGVDPRLAEELLS
jgi:DNA-binding MarR family transcriptional regulator